MHAVRNNFAKFAQELLAAGADVKAVDNRGWNVIHHLVLPSEIGTWENIALLKVLAAAGADVNAKDLEGHTPLYYASAFTSNKLKNALQALGATSEGVAPLPACFEPVPEDYWRQARVDIGADSKAFLAKNRIKVEREVLKPSVDSSADMKGIGTVYVDESGLAYDLMMTRVDLTYGNWGMNRFYKMQLIFNKVSNR
jgi:poly [ADP-ribose] polymerase/centrosomal protein CEP128